ncbi:MAG: phage shock protein operon transcriptional activator [Maricaulaceae bacterium]
MTPDELPKLVGSAPAFLAALEHVSAAAPLERPLLVIGERGTGKELFAARIHFLSQRWDKTYLSVNCAALSEDLLESELFGHEAGAFTGAQKRHEGRFERADGGTLFLDEIANTSLRVQEKLLRVIEYGQFERVGGERTLSVDVRVVGATNEDLPAKAARGAFRADLLDRLAFDVITLPPLRHRKEDIARLAYDFGRNMANELGEMDFQGFSAPVLAELQRHDWPGNVRELKNTVERAVYRALADPDRRGKPIDALTLDPFESAFRPAKPPLSPTAEPTAAAPLAPRPLDEMAFAEQVADFERQLVEAALSQETGHQGRAADRLGLSYHQFRGLLKKHGVDARAYAGRA